MSEDSSDEELFSLICSHDDYYYQMLLKRYLKKYKYIVKRTANELQQRNVDADDYLLIFYTSFQNAVDRYDAKQCKFSSFFYLIFRRAIKNELLKQIKSFDMMDHSISLDELISEESHLYEMIENKDADNPVSYVKTSEMRLYLRGSSQKPLSAKEQLRQQVVIMRSEGMTLKEISQKLNIHISKVRRLLDPNSNVNLKKMYVQLK